MLPFRRTTPASTLATGRPSPASPGPALDRGPVPSGSPSQGRAPWDRLREGQTFEWLKIKRRPTRAAQATVAGGDRGSRGGGPTPEIQLLREAADQAGEGAPAAYLLQSQRPELAAALYLRNDAGQDLQNLGPKQKRWRKRAGCEPGWVTPLPGSVPQRQSVAPPR